MVELKKTSPKDALIREVKEELGLEVRKVDKPTSIWFFSPLNDPTKQIILLNYRCQISGAVPKLDKKCSNLAWITPQKFLNLSLPHESLKYAIAQEYKLPFQPFRSGKLVRNKIPDLMRTMGKRKIRIKRLTNQEYFQALLEKLEEEAKEAASAKNKKELTIELADILEVIETILKVAKISVGKVKKNKNKRKKQRGGFEKKLSLLL
jgi:predicted house-cleaning noncanonical NTP pyrophosphatase (MazG superfamily)